MATSDFAPGLANLSSYRPAWLRHDVIAGLVLTALLVPQGMAYAELAGLPPITGLYTSILCLVAYAVFGPSKILVLGPDSSLGPMIAATVIPLIGAHGDPERAVALASALALMVGAIITLAGIVRLGFIADLISKPTIIGYMNGLALTILVGQLPKLFGFSVKGDGFRAEITGFVQGVARTAVAEQSGAKTQVTGLVGAMSIVLILLFVPGLLRNLPQPTLAAVVIAASLSLADIPETRRLYKVRRSEFLLSISAFGGVVLLGVLPGIAIAVGLSISNVFRRAWWPYQTVLGRVPGLAGYHDLPSYAE